MNDAIVKQCGCGATFTDDGPEEHLDLRNCPCGSTIALELSTKENRS